MTRSRPTRALAALLCSAFVLLPGCVCIHQWQKSLTAKHRQVELADVAKSWCQTIRASQVIPVYPLTEDLQPGDVFLVRRSIEDQAYEYLKKGFLPLDNHFMRLDPAGYGKFYSHSVLANDVAGEPEEGPTVGDGRQDPPRVPAQWMRPGALPPEPGWEKTTWDTAPRASFPSYSFSVQSGAGFNLAVPVQGVPVGLGLLGNQSASGTIAISDAFTLGVDMLSMWEQLRRELEEQPGRLSLYAATPNATVYLRVVTRIYLAGAMEVTISSQSSASGGLDVGVPRPIELLTTTTDEEGNVRTATAQEYAENVGAINKMLEATDDMRPGGSLRLTLAGGNSVGMSETFEPPLVIGYLGFDCEILPGGVVGPPVPTLITLTRSEHAQKLFKASRAAFTYDRAALADGLRFLREAVDSQEAPLPGDLRDSAKGVIAALDALGSEAKNEMPAYQRVTGTETFTIDKSTFGARAGVAEEAGYDRFKAYRRSLERSLLTLQAASEEESFQLQEGNAAPVSISPGSDAFAPLAQDRERIQGELDRISALDESAVRDLRAWLVLYWSNRS